MRLKNPLKSMRFSGLLLLILVLTAPSVKSASFIHMGQVMGLEVQAEYMGYDEVNDNGEYVFQQGQSMAYRIRLRNRGNRSMSQLEVQSSLHSDGVSCEEVNLYPGSRLPGEAISPVHTVSVSPGQIYEYESIYSVPSAICDSSGNLKVRVQYSLAGRTHSATLIAPAHYRFK